MKLAHDWFPGEIPDNVVLGDGVYVDSSYSFHHFRSQRPVGLRVGANSSLYEDASFELGPDGEVEVGTFTMLFGGKFNANSRIEIGDYTLISYETYFADTFAPISPTDPSAPTVTTGQPATSISVGSVCWIGVRATVLAPARLGDGVIVAAGSLVDFDCPDYAVVAGNPARIIGWSRPHEA